MTQSRAMLVVATRNPGKLREIKLCLSDLPIEIRSLRDYPHIGDIEESGDTFVDNALLKARAVQRAVGGYVLADDSGLECDDLGGAPGPQSARYGGPGASDEDNNRKLIEDLLEIHDPCRRARYRCALVLIDPKNHETVIEENCDGVITLTPGGSGGFGYDPYFFLPDYNCTMAELPLEEKNRISHRGKALCRVHEVLKKALQHV